MVDVYVLHNDQVALARRAEEQGILRELVRVRSRHLDLILHIARDAVFILHNRQRARRRRRPRPVLRITGHASP